jgi:hypothetical protein
MDKFKFFILCIGLFNTFVNAQNALELSNLEFTQKYPNQIYIYKKDSVLLKKKDKDDKEQIKALRNNILESIAQNISVQVYSVTHQQISEQITDQQTQFNNQFYSQTNTSTNIEIHHIELEEFNYNPKTKYLTGLVIVNKVKLAETSILKANKGMEVLITQLQQAKYTNELSDLSAIEKNYQNYKLWFNICVILNPTAQGVKIFDKLHQQYQQLLLDIKRSNQEIQLQNQIVQIKKYQQQQNYTQALQLCDKALQDKPYLTVLTQIKNEIEIDFKIQTQKQANFYIAQNNFQQALHTTQLFLQYFPLNDDILNLQLQIQQQLFKQINQEIKWELQQGKTTSAQQKLQILHNYKGINLNEYLSTSALVLNQAKQQEFKQLKLNYKNKQYLTVWDKIPQLSNLYGNDDFLTKMQKKAQHKLYLADKKEFKKTQPKLWAIFGAVEANGQLFFLDQLQDFTYNQAFYLSYSIALTRKFNIQENVSKGKDYSTSNYLGLKLKYLTPNTTFNYSTTPYNFVGNPSYQINLMVIAPQILFWEYGIVLGANTVHQYLSPHYFAFGVHLASHNLSLNLGVQSYTNYSSPLQIQAILALQYRLPFKSKFTKAHKTQILSKYVL